MCAELAGVLLVVQRSGFLKDLASARTVSGSATHVRDGDTIELNGLPIRLKALDCAERDTTEGQRATRRMKLLVAGQNLTCRLSGRRSYDRETGECSTEDRTDAQSLTHRQLGIWAERRGHARGFDGSRADGKIGGCPA